jgi:hypothetical protein
LNLSPINNLYLSSPNLGTFTTLSPTGSMNVIKKIPVSAVWGYMIIDRVVSQRLPRVRRPEPPDTRV